VEFGAEAVDHFVEFWVVDELLVVVILDQLLLRLGSNTGLVLFHMIMLDQISFDVLLFQSRLEFFLLTYFGIPLSVNQEVHLHALPEILAIVIQVLVLFDYLRLQIQILLYGAVVHQLGFYRVDDDSVQQSLVLCVWLHALALLRSKARRLCIGLSFRPFLNGFKAVEL
jgi:hypothetical protein